MSNLIIENGRVVDGTGQPAFEGSVLVQDGKIAAVGADADTQAAAKPDLKRIDATGQTVMPGLIDLHVHLTGDPGGDFWKSATEPTEWGVVVGAKNARITALAGFTTVREAGSSQHSAFALRRGTADGVIPGPRIIAAGPALAIVGGHGDVSGFRPEVNEVLTSGYTCTGAVECAEAVRRAGQNGVRS